MNIACRAGNEQCLYDTYVQVHLYADHDRKLPRGLEHVIYCNGLKGAGKQGEWTEMWMKMQNSSDSDYRLELIQALGCSEDAVVLKDYLESTLGSSNSVGYGNSEKLSVVRSVLRSPIGLQVVINFMKDFEQDVLSAYGLNSLWRLLTASSDSIRTRQQQTTFIDFLLTLENLDAESFKELVGYSLENLEVSENPENAHILNIIHKIVLSLQEPDDNTTIMPTTDGSTPSTPPTPPTAPTTVSPPSTDGTTSTTTLGASTIGIRLLTLLTTLFVAFVMQH
jgi:hypothetical protein